MFWILDVSASTAPLQYLYKVISVNDWNKSQHRQYVHTTPMDNSYSIVSTEDQLQAVIDKSWRGVADFVVLTLDVNKLDHRLIFEMGREKDKINHLVYEGMIPVDAVIAANVLYNPWGLRQLNSRPTFRIAY